MSQHKTVVAIALSLTLSLRPACAQTEIKRTSDLNVLLITLDTTRADHIGCYGYLRAKTPNIDQLARDGVKFVNAYAQVPLTLPSHSSIMTGTYPLYHQVHDNGYYYLGSENETLAKILKRNGYKTAAFVSSFTVDSPFSGSARGSTSMTINFWAMRSSRISDRRERPIRSLPPFPPG